MEDTNKNNMHSCQCNGNGCMAHKYGSAFSCHHHYLLRWILGLVLIIMVFTIGFDMGQFKGEAMSGGFGYGMHNRVMMRGGYGAGMGGGMMMGATTTAPAAAAK